MPLDVFLLKKIAIIVIIIIVALISYLFTNKKEAFSNKIPVTENSKKNIDKYLFI